MFFDFRRTGFLRPRERLYELLALEHFADSGGTSDSRVEGTFDRRTLRRYGEVLQKSGFIEATGDGGFRLTETGRSRARYLLVDLVRELRGLNERAHDILRRSLAPLAFAGIKRVAFYPFSETAEVAAALLEDLGLELVAVIDDDPGKQGARFRHLRIEPLEALREKQVEAVIVTTAVFRDKVMERINDLNLTGVRVQEL